MRWEQHYDWRRGIVYGGGQEPGKQTSFQTQNTTTTSEPSPTLQPGLKQIAGNFMDNFNPTRPSFFPGEMVAPLSGQTQTGISDLFNRGANGSPLMRTGDSSITDTLGGKFLDPGNNPYLQKYLRAGLDQQNDSFNALTVPGIRSQFAGSGAISAASMSMPWCARATISTGCRPMRPPAPRPAPIRASAPTR